MDLFEYLTVAISIVLAFGVTTLLRSLRDLLSRSRRYWVHAVWVFQLLFLHAQMWWAYWDYQTGVEWTFLGFLILLTGPALLYLMSTTLVLADRETSWRDHFYGIRVWFFSVVAVYGVFAISISWVLKGVSLTHPYRLVQVTMLAIAGVGLASRSHRVHAALACFGLFFFAASQFAFRYLPTGL